MVPPNTEESFKEQRSVNLVHDHDALVEMKFRVAGLAEINEDHEVRLRALENERVRKLEDQQNEWKGALKTWGIIWLVFQVALNFLVPLLLHKSGIP